MRRIARIAALSGALALVAAPSRAVAQAARAVPSSRTSHGFAADRLARIDRFLQQYVDSNRIGGAVALVLRDGQVAYQRAVGWTDRESSRPMTADAMFRIASQSKAITSAAILVLVEEGKIALGDPVSRFIPAYARTTVASHADSGRTMVPARRQITIHDLLTHTAGISYGGEAHVAAQYQASGLGRAAGSGWYTADKSELVCETMERLATLPFVAQPGEAYVYGYNTDILGCVVERASGVPLDEFIRTRITGPLGMSDTYFFVPSAKAARLVTLYMNDSTGRVARAPEGSLGQGHYVDGPRRNFSGGAGIVSTARDYARFLQMMLNRGELDGVRILSPRMVDLMTTNQSGTLYSQNGMGFGLGFETVERLGGKGVYSVGSFGWGGAYGSSYMVDPVERLVLVFMINQMPLRTDVASKFPTLVYQALTDLAPRSGWPTRLAPP
ncbi:MAG TPA: serine hydrolase domain-containing protein [Gemmatimonadaceae bacterium]|nr:serine hydrolase domain-containing protein [Gemmatimonadaceae bacterium]